MAQGTVLTWEKRVRNGAMLVTRKYPIQKSAKRHVMSYKYHPQNRSKMASYALKGVITNASRAIVSESRLSSFARK